MQFAVWMVLGSKEIFQCAGDWEHCQREWMLRALQFGYMLIIRPYTGVTS